MAQHREQKQGIIIQHNVEQTVVVTPVAPSPDIVDLVERYDPGSGTWTERAPMKKARAGFNLHTTYEYLWAIGGTNGSEILKSVEEYDEISNTWTNKTDMPTARMFYQSAVWQDYIFVIGGVTANAFGQTSITAVVERYDTVHDTWTTMTALPGGVAMGFAQTVGNKIYVMGGYLNSMPDTPNNDIYVYNALTDTWSTVIVADDQLVLYRRMLPFSYVSGTNIIALDGLYFQQDVNGKTQIYLTSAYSFDTTTDILTQSDYNFSDLPRPRLLGGTASLGTVHYLIGGQDPESNTLRQFESINENTTPNTFTKLTNLPRGRSAFGATGTVHAYGDYIYMAGGVASNQGEQYLQVELQAVPDTITLNGKQTGAINIHVADENGNAPASVNVRLQATPGPILFTEDVINVVNGFATATLLPRADDNNNITTMSDGLLHGYTVSISGAVIDPVYFGESTPLPPDSTGDFSATPKNGLVSLSLPAGVTLLKEYDSVLSPDQLTRGSYLQLGIVANFITLTPIQAGSNQAASVNWSTTQSWTPTVVPLINDNNGTFDRIRPLLDRMSREQVYGGSPLLDAVLETTQTIELDPSQTGKMIYVLSDGEDNSEHSSVDDVFAEIQAVAQPLPIVCSGFRVIPKQLHLDQGVRDGSASLEALAYGSNGSIRYIVTDEDVTLAIENVLMSRGFIGDGLFSCSIDLGEEVKIESIEANFALPDAETEAYWHYSIGDANNHFTLLSERIDANQSVTLFQVEGKTVNIVAEFIAHLSLDTYNAQKIVPPRLESIRITYHKKTTSYIYFNPETAPDKLHQIMITLDADQPEGSNISVAATTEPSNTWDDYSSPAQPAVDNSTRIVVPIRVALDDTQRLILEPLVSVDGFIYRATYGKWANNSDVNVYDEDGNTIDPTSYRIFPHKGFVVFNQKQVQNFILEISNKPVVAVAAEIVNRVHGKPVVVNGAGYMYSTLEPKSLTRQASNVLPEAINLLVTPLEPNVDSIFRALYTYYDLKGRAEKGTTIQWFINDSVQTDIANLKEWDNKIWKLAKVGDTVYFVVTPKNAEIAGISVKSVPVKVTS